jgi:hypothetical protein
LVRSGQKRGESATRSAKEVGGAWSASPTSSSSTNAAPDFSRDALFAFANPLNRAQLDAALPAPAREVHYVRLNAALIEGKQSPFWRKPGTGRVEFPLPRGGTLAVIIDESEMLGADRFTSMGHLEGRPGSRAVFAWNQGFLHASIEDAELGSFALRAATESLAQFYHIERARVGPWGGARHPIVDKGFIGALGRIEIVPIGW